MKIFVLPRWTWPYAFFALLSLAILGPLLRPGYVLSLDMAFGPRVDHVSFLFGLSPDPLVANAPLKLIQQVTTAILPNWVFQKVYFFAIFFLAGLGAYKLLPQKGASAYFAGLLYVVNPFVYARFVAGQIGVLAAYALIPFAIGAFLTLLRRPTTRNALRVSLLSTAVTIFSFHGAFLLFLVFGCFFVARAATLARQLRELQKVTVGIVLSGLGFLALNAYWLAPVLTSGSPVLGEVGAADNQIFAPSPVSGASALYDIVSLHGFWRPGIVYAINIVPFWGAWFFLLFFLAVLGLLSPGMSEGSAPGLAYPKLWSRWVAYTWGVIAVISIILGAGMAVNSTRPVFEAFWGWVPGFRAFRDSQKFVALLALAYAYLGGLGMAQMTQLAKENFSGLRRKAALTAAALGPVAVLAYTFTMFGTYGHLKLVDYPQDWYDVDSYLKRDADDFNVLFLPWHQYMDYSWSPNRDKRLANPARDFFSKPIIRGDNIEVPGIYSQSQNPVSKYVEFLLERGRSLKNLGELLSLLNVKYVILIKESDYESYDFLYQQDDLVLELEKPNILLFRNQHPTARAYAVDEVVPVRDLAEYVELSQKQDALGNLYVIDRAMAEGSPAPAGEGAKVPGDRVDLSRASPVSYRAPEHPQRYLVFTMPQADNWEHWEFKGKESMGNLGFIPAFSTDGVEGDIVYTRFHRVYLPSYAVSGIALVLAILVILPWRGRRAKGTDTS